jgi:hypothetical protein
MKNILLAILISFTISFTIIATGYADSKIFSHEVLQIIHKHWTNEDKVFIQLDNSVCDSMTDDVCRLLDQLFEEAHDWGWTVRFVGECKPYPMAGAVAYHDNS